MLVRTSGCQPPQALQLSQSSAQHPASPTYSRAAVSPFMGSNQPGTAVSALRRVAFIRCREHKPELKTQTWIRQGSPASSAVLQPVPNVATHNLDFNRLLQSGAGKGVQEPRVATRPHLPFKAGKNRFVGASLKQSTVKLPQTSISCWLGFHCPLVNTSNTPWLCWRGKSIAQLYLPQQSVKLFK